jgi:hypothetical protein
LRHLPTEYSSIWSEIKTKRPQPEDILGIHWPGHAKLSANPQPLAELSENLAITLGTLSARKKLWIFNSASARRSLTLTL